MAWNAAISVKCNGKLNDTHWEAIKQWGWAERLWSTSGEWDFQLICNDHIANQDELEKAVFQLRSQAWVSDTNTQWWKAL